MGKSIELYSKKPKINEGTKTCVSLFSGIIGLELGLHKAGFAVKLCIDIDKSAHNSVKLNFPELDYVIGDISDVTSSFILERIACKKGDINLLTGGLPCQPFSKSGLRRGLNDKRGPLFEHYIELLIGLEPRAFIIENVRGIASSRKGQDWKEILNKFRKTRYTLYWKVLDAANYGVPQFRQRLFLVGFRKRIKFSFPEKTHGHGKVDYPLKPFVTVQDAIGHLRSVKDYPPYQGKYAHLLKDIPEGLNYSYYCKERGHPNPLFKWRSKFWYFLLKIDRNRPSLTIQACPGNNTGPFHWENRKLGISELERLQTIPEWFNMTGSYMTKHRHIGNAVPPVLAHKIGVQLGKALDEDLALSESEYHRLLDRESKLFKIDSGRRSGKGKLYAVNNRKTVLCSIHK